MDSNECWFAFHDTCSMPEYCECLCHISVDDLMAEWFLED